MFIKQVALEVRWFRPLQKCSYHQLGRYDIFMLLYVLCLALYVSYRTKILDVYDKLTLNSNLCRDSGAFYSSYHCGQNWAQVDYVVYAFCELHFANPTGISSKRNANSWASIWRSDVNIRKLHYCVHICSRGQYRFRYFDKLLSYWHDLK